MALDTLKSSQIITESETLSSSDGAFKLGFFSPINSSNHYLAIWYLDQKTIVWVANRNQPLQDSSGIFTISEDHNLVVMNGKRQVLWSSNLSSLTSNSIAQLLDSGNLVLQDVNTEETLWESFKHPGNTFFPKMKEPSNNKITGKKVQATSWKSPSDPSIGIFSMSLEHPNLPELLVWSQAQPYWRSGPWNGTVFLGIQDMVSGYLHGFRIGNENDGTVYLNYLFPNGSPFYALIVLNPQGMIEVPLWQNKKKITNRYWNLQNSDCDIYGFCGAFGSCNSQASPICSCLKGFEPRNVEEWNKQNWTSGCVRRTPLKCERAKNGSESVKEDGFSKLQKTKVPDFLEQSSTVSEDTCRSQCLQNCSCIAYAYDPVISCMYWSGNLTDIVRFSKGGVNLYIRLANSELGDTDSDRDMRVIVTVLLLLGIVIFTACAYLLWTWCAKHSGRENHGIQKHVELDEIPLLKLEELATATNNFHSDNMLGEGGFGPVYKGVLKGGQQIAIKRLSIASGQDFGLARIFKGNDDEANTKRVIGTYGYMSPEYAMKGYYSEKSDVYSFGVILLEIVIGRRNSTFDQNDEDYLGLTKFAWRLWNEGNIMSLIDPEMSYSMGDREQIMRCIHIGLLCVQELAGKRPSMSTVLGMFNSEIVNLPPPEEVGFL
ncbi:hypothetical protein L6164_036517 [Bauhinia variegata]|uniref:Uncharacterized protein n=1 Tax=Bauhinia variegata TaxID=167791 RepID=A0ACB9KHA0_BAUVA|nr:hypothetical protein L6164_036517 [Bauhinia variegata]